MNRLLFCIIAVMTAMITSCKKDDAGFTFTIPDSTATVTYKVYDPDGDSTLERKITFVKGWSNLERTGQEDTTVMVTGDTTVVGDFDYSVEVRLHGYKQVLAGVGWNSIDGKPSKTRIAIRINHDPKSGGGESPSCVMLDEPLIVSSYYVD